jgi:hypothetical protein
MKGDTSSITALGYRRRMTGAPLELHHLHHLHHFSGESRVESVWVKLPTKCCNWCNWWSGLQVSYA